LRVLLLQRIYFLEVFLYAEWVLILITNYLIMKSLDQAYNQYLYDSSIRGLDTSTGNYETIYNEDALANAFRIWLLSRPGDNLRNLRGFNLHRYVGKPLSLEMATTIQQDLRQRIEDDFNPILTVVSLEVSPNYEKRQFDIALTAISTEIQLAMKINESLKVS
jgi:hypothetical protein